MNRSLALILVLSLVAGTATTGAQTQSTGFYVSGVSVSPQTPAPGERFTITASVVNGDSAQSAIEITDVAIRSASGTEYKRIENVGTLPPGTRMQIPVTLSFDDPGTRELRVIVYGRGNNTRVERRWPVVVNVRQGGLQLGVEVGDPVVGAETAVSVTAANGGNGSVQNLQISLEGRNAAVDDPTRVAATLAAGAERTFAFNATPRARDAAVTATLQYTTAEGNDRTVRQTLPLDAAPLREDVRVDVAVRGEGASPPVRVDVSNFGNAPLTQAVVSASVNGTTYARRSLGPVAAESERAATLNLSGVPPESETLDVTVDYRTGGRRGSASTQVAYSSNPARIELTGVSVEREGDHLLVSGSASNVGLSDASSTVVSVVSADGVTPVSPNREYFVGTVPASDFVSFDLTARVDDGVSRIPVRVSYIADGVRQTNVVEVPVGDVSPPESGGDGGPLLLVLVGGLVALVVVVGVGAYAFVRR